MSSLVYDFPGVIRTGRGVQGAAPRFILKLLVCLRLLITRSEYSMHGVLGPLFRFGDRSFAGCCVAKLASSRYIWNNVIERL